jgi:hypothetical protein
MASTLFLFTGCSSFKTLAVKVPYESNYCKAKYKLINQSTCAYISSKEGKDIYVVDAISSFSDYGFVHMGINNAVTAALQAAAETTLLANKSYFAIISPTAISNMNNILINTPEDYIKNCTTSMGTVLTLSSSNCGVKGTRKNGVITFKAYDERPHDILVYDAKEVIQYYKDNDLYDDEERVEDIIVFEEGAFK